MLRTKQLVVVASLVVAMAAPGIADTKRVQDPQEGTFAPIDAKSARHDHASQGAAGFAGMVLVHEVTMYDEWSNDQLKSFVLRMRSKRWDKPRRLFVQHNDDGTLYGTIWSGDRLRGYARVHRPDARTLRISFPKSALGNDVRSYRWFMLMTGPWECPPDVTCAPPPAERVPDTGTVPHRGLWRYNE
ncbi:MAG TPA: hypothetical protein VG929_09640 [Actinomycetota bacterium]|nr:hypothetical protein [Actinomycetota bacterium]